MKDLIIIGAGPIGLACGIEAKKNNLDYPVIANINSKGPTIRNLILNFNKEVYFIDDMIFNLKSTYEEVPHVKLIHYVSDKRLEKLIETRFDELF